MTGIINKYLKTVALNLDLLSSQKKLRVKFLSKMAELKIYLCDIMSKIRIKRKTYSVLGQ